MFELINTMKEFWLSGSDAGEKMPVVEKEHGEKVLYSSTIHKVRIEGNIEIAYIEEGKKDAPVILFIHGMGGAVPSWRKNISFLRQHYRCIAIDLPGHGHSSKDEYPYTMNFYSDVVLSFIHRLGLSDVTLMGHSMGGQIAVVTALKQPETIAKLILVSPAGFEPYTPLEKQILINMQAGVSVGAQAFTMHKYNYLLGFCNDQEAAGDLLKRLPFYKDDAHVFGKMMLRSVESMLLESVNERLDKLKAPCLVLLGSEDKVSPYPYLRQEEYFEVVKREARKIPRSKTFVFAPGGHFIHYQNSKKYNAIVQEFLKEAINDKR